MKNRREIKVILYVLSSVSSFLMPFFIFFIADFMGESVKSKIILFGFIFSTLIIGGLLSHAIELLDEDGKK